MTFRVSGGIHFQQKILLNPVLVFNPFSSYSIDNSCIFDIGSNTFMTNTTSTPTDQNVWTFSTWLKRGDLTGGIQSFFTDNAGSNTAGFNFRTDDRFSVQRGNIINLRTTQVFRDTTAWYHIVIVYNSDEVTASDRLNIWLNGNLITDFDIETYPSLGANFGNVNANGNTLQLGRNTASNPFRFDGYLSDTIFVDGQALAPTDFGQFDASSGIWVPINYSGTYGNNGFRLDYSDSVNLGHDVSGNSNDWTENNFTTANQSNDSPTNNFCTLHPAAPNTPITYEFGNLRGGHTGANAGLASGTFATRTSKWYYEATVNNIGSGGDFPYIGWAQMPFNFDGDGLGARIGDASFTAGQTGFAYGRNGEVHDHFTSTPGGTAVTNNDVVSIAVDFDTGNAWVAVNGTYESGDPALGTNPSFTGIVVGNTYTPAASLFGAATDVEFNFGQKSFVHTQPSGFQGLSKLNLISPSVVKPDTLLDTLHYAGDGISPRALTGLNFQPDFVWIKVQNFNNDPHLTDSVRGVNNTLFTNSTSQALVDNDEGYVSAFNSNGFELTAGSTSDDEVNDSVSNYFSMCLRRDERFFDVVTYTGTGVVQNIAHNLNKKPNWIWVKSRSGNLNWLAYADPFPVNGVPDPNPGQYFYNLNGTTGAVADSTVWNNTDATASQFTVGTAIGVNNNGGDYIAYLFASESGLCDIGIYRPNLNVNGPVIYTGFRPKTVVVRIMDSTGTFPAFYHNDGTGYNPATRASFINSTSADGTSGYDIDFLSTGFKIRSTIGNLNSTSSGNFDYIYMAFAEFPANWGPAF